MRTLRFVSAPGGSAFMHELLGVVAHEVAAVLPRGGFDAVSLEEGPLVGAPDDVFVVVPHEYFRVLPPDLHPDRATRRRTIAFCVEHPGNQTFDTTLETAATVAACVDINDDSAAVLASHGLRVERFHLGYSERWDRWGGAATERDVDVLYLGTTDPRRNRLLGTYTEALIDADVFFAVPPHEPMVRRRPDFFMGDEKLDLLGRSKILLNLHRGASRSFEWVRGMEAMCNGAVVVTEHSSDLAPLVPGVHVVSGAPQHLGALCRALLRDGDRLAAMRDEVYRWLREERRMGPSAAVLVDLAADLGSTAPRTRAAAAAPAERPAWPGSPAGIGRCDRAPDGPTDPTWTRYLIRPAATPADTVTVLVRGRPRAGDTAHVAQLAREVEGDVEGDPVHAAIDTVLGAPCQAVLVLEPGDRLVPGALERLLSALTAHPELDGVHGMAVAADGSLRSAMPFEAGRVASVDYLALASLWRPQALAAAAHRSDDGTTHGLWQAAAALGQSFELIPRPLARCGS